MFNRLLAEKISEVLAIMIIVVAMVIVFFLL